MAVEIRVRVIAVGDELLEGRTADTNSGRIQRAFGGHAARFDLVQVVPDRPEAIIQALERTSPGDLVVMCGGLGSTPDDLTREAVAAWAGVNLAENAAAMATILERYQARGKTPRPEVAKQAQVPEGMIPLANPVGSAPALLGMVAQRWLVMLPGVPSELAGLLPLVLAELESRGVLPDTRCSLVRRCAQIPELALVQLCQPVMSAHPGLTWSWWVTDWGVDVRVAAERDQESELKVVGEQLDTSLGHLVFCDQDVALPEVVQGMMLARGFTCGVAESCTSGLVGGALTAAAGASDFFRGGFLVYDNQIKNRLLAIDPGLLQTEGAVSEPVVRSMAENCRLKLGCTHALAVSGIAGPGGGTTAKPVGTTWIAVATAERTWSHCYRFPAGRQRNRLLAVASAVDTLRRVVQFSAEVDPWGKSTAWSKEG